MRANEFSVWLVCVLAATLLVLTVIRAPAMPAPTCDEVRETAKQYTKAEIWAMARRAKITRAQWAELMACIGNNTK